MAYLTCNSSDLLESDWAKLTQRLDHLEDANNALVRENAMLRKNMTALEEQVSELAVRFSDTASKVKVMRESCILPSTTRVFDNFDILEHILLFCPLTQLYSMQSVSKSFLRTFEASARLRSKMFANPSEALPDLIPSSSTHALWAHLSLNPLFSSPWTRTALASYLTLELFRSSNSRARYLVSTDLSATFECRIASAEQSHYALKQLRTSLGRTYVTRPALPTTVWVAFLVPALIEDARERQRALRVPTSVPPNVSAVVNVAPASLLEMFEVAEAMRKYFPRTTRARVDPRGVAWEPFASPLAEHDELLLRATGLMRSTPEYGGWRVAQSRAHSLSDVTDWL